MRNTLDRLDVLNQLKKYCRPNECADRIRQQLPLPTASKDHFSRWFSPALTPGTRWAAADVQVSPGNNDEMLAVIALELYARGSRSHRRGAARKQLWAGRRDAAFFVKPCSEAPTRFLHAHA